MAVETRNSKRTYLGKTVDGRDRWRLEAHIGAIQFRENGGEWQDIDPNFEEPDTGGFSLKFTKLPYLIRVAQDSKRRIYPDRTDLSYWIEFQKPFANMGVPTRQDGWFYWNFAHAIIGIKVRNQTVKFVFRLKDNQTPTSITIPFSVQGITRHGNLLYHDGKIVGYLQKPTATDALGVEKDCQVSWAVGSVTVSLDTTGLTFPIDVDPTFSVSTSTDDCRCNWNGSAWLFSLTLIDQQAGYYSNLSLKIGGGMRFQAITIPQGAIINTAYLTFVCSNSDSGVVVNTRITGNDVDDAATWSTLADYQARRGTIVGGANNNYITDAQVDWDAIPAWTETTSYNSPSIVSIIQEIVNRAGWVSGNDLALWWDDHDDRSTHAAYCFRRGASWDDTSYAPPALTVEWTVAALGRSHGYIIG